MTPSCPNTAASNINLVPLDATNDAIYPFLSTFFQEMRSLFTDSYMHIGGDEGVLSFLTALVFVVISRYCIA